MKEQSVFIRLLFITMSIALTFGNGYTYAQDKKTDCSLTVSNAQYDSQVEAPLEINSPTDTCTPANPREKTDKINIHIHPLFDENNPAEDHYIFRLANRLHIETHENVIKRDLLVKEGDYIDPNLLAESERILRTRRYFNRATVAATENNQVDVDVYQVWTLVPALSYSRAGGNTTSSIGLHDSNFLGLGKVVNILHNANTERSGDTFEYLDPNTGWHQTTLGLAYENNSDGTRRYAEFIRPYFALDTVNAGGFTYETFEQEDALYDAGKKVSTYAENADKHEFFYGSKINIGNKKSIHRWNIGYTQDDHEFLSLPDALVTPIPSSRNLHTTWLEYTFIQDGFIKLRNIQQINRDEDINLGLQLRTRLGRTQSLNPEHDKSFQLSGEISKGLSLSENNLVLAKVEYDARYNQNSWYNSVISGQLNYHWKNLKHGQFYLSLEGACGQHLFGDQSFDLGGDTGLRGYPAFYQSGDKRYLLTVEQRFFGEHEWFSLFHLGYAAFYDQGRAWGDSLIPQSQTETLRDLGVGLRISGTRNGNRDAGGHNVLHIDVATPLDGGSDISNLQWLVKVRNSF